MCQLPPWGLASRDQHFSLSATMKKRAHSASPWKDGWSEVRSMMFMNYLVTQLLVIYLFQPIATVFSIGYRWFLLIGHLVVPSSTSIYQLILNTQFLCMGDRHFLFVPWILIMSRSMKDLKSHIEDTMTHRGGAVKVFSLSDWLDISWQWGRNTWLHDRWFFGHDGWILKALVCF